MVPIHDTDLAEERWSQTEWEGYELWEKVEQREKRKKKFWIFSAILSFLVLSAVPICIERWPYWLSRTLTRQLAQEVNQMKRMASTAKSPYRLRFTEDSGLQFVIEKVPSCNGSGVEPVTASVLGRSAYSAYYTWINPVLGDALSIPGLVREFCYDPLLGSDIVNPNRNFAGFAMIPVKDLSEKRLDRMSILLLTGPSAEISFE